MRRKLKKEIQNMIEQRMCNLYSSEVKHRIYEPQNPGTWAIWSMHNNMKSFTMSQVLHAILEYCGLKLDWEDGTQDSVVINKKPKDNTVVYKKKTVRKK